MVLNYYVVVVVVVHDDYRFALVFVVVVVVVLLYVSIYNVLNLGLTVVVLLPVYRFVEDNSCISVSNI